MSWKIPIIAALSLLLLSATWVFVGLVGVGYGRYSMAEEASKTGRMTYGSLAWSCRLEQ